MSVHRTGILFLIIAAFAPFSGQLSAQIQPNGNNVVFVNKNAEPGGNGQTWATAVKELADVLKWAREQTDGGQASWSENSPLSVWVAEGVYKPLYNCQDGMYTQSGSGKLSAFVLVRNVRLLGGFRGDETSEEQRDRQAYKTHLSGDHTGNDVVSGLGTGITIEGFDENAYHTVIATGSLGAAILDGFVVSGGSADFRLDMEPPYYTVNGYQTYPNSGGGMFCLGTNVTVSNCDFTGNYAANSGGGVYAPDSRLNFSNCTFGQNLAARVNGGGIYTSSNQAQQFTDCVFRGNGSRSGGGASVRGGGPVSFTGCTFMWNDARTGGGLYVVPAPVTIAGTKFLANTASTEGGAFYNEGAHPQIINSEFAGNLADQKGGGIFSKQGVPTMINCTVAGNNAAEGGGIYGDGVTGGFVKNSLVWHNSSGIGGGTFSFDHSLVQGMPATGEGNLDGTIARNNIFVSPVAYSSAPTTDGTYRLAPGSPVIDKGSNGNIPSGVNTDGDNFPRIAKGTVDMGAYEYSGGWGWALYVDAAASPGGDGTSWSRAFKTLTEALAAAEAYPYVTLLVAGGTYYPTGAQIGTDRDKAFPVLRGGIKILGGYNPATGERDFSSASVLSGEINGGGTADNSYHVMVIALANAADADSVVVDGFTITGGNADGVDPVEYRGILVYRNIGGGLYISNNTETGKIAVRNCIISANYAGSLAGGVYGHNVSALFQNTLFSGNRAGSDGQTGFGAALLLGSAEGISTGSSIVNCTFAGNYTLPANAAVFNTAGAAVTIKNSLIWGNSGGLTGTGQQAVSYSLIQGRAGGSDGNPDGTIAYPGMFVDNVPFSNAPTAAGNYALVINSPAVDKGSDAAASGIATDLAFNPRIMEERVDIGAYEFFCTENTVLSDGAPVTIGIFQGQVVQVGRLCERISVIQSPPFSGYTGAVTVRSWLADDIIRHGSARYVPRYHAFSASPPVSSELYVTLYFENSDFKAYNLLYGNEHNAKLPDIDEETPVTGNLRVVQYHGTGSGNSLPATYPGPRTLLQPLQVVWDAALQLWKVTFRTVGFSGFFVTGQSDAALPVTLLSFTAEKQEKGVQLTWQTTVEKDFSHFEVERSSDGRSFVNIGKVSAKGESGPAWRYGYIDHSPAAAISYYRLKMVDNDGSFGYSPVESVSFDRSRTAYLYPNPSPQGYVKLDANGLKVETISVYDLSGRKVGVEVTLMQGSGYELNFSGASPGIYHIVIAHESGVITRKHVVY